jgi:hypothetical protein
MNRNFTQKVLCFLALFACLSGMAAHAQTRSYYVRADGSDSNNGRSEDAPFKTLKKAVETAKMGAIKTITVIGTIREEGSIRDTGNDEILITGKPDASDAEKAVINGQSIYISRAKVRFTHIRIEPGSYGVAIEGEVTFGEGVVVTGSPSDSDLRSLVSVSGMLTMTGNAEITGNTRGGGISGADRSDSTIIMTGSARVTNNAVGIDRAGTLSMSEDAEISGNRNRGIAAEIVKLSGNAKIINNGGGILADTVVLEGNTLVSGNINGYGGGVYARKTVTLSGNAKIINNTGSTGGGVFTEGTVVLSGNAVISGNSAGKEGAVSAWKDKAPEILTTDIYKRELILVVMMPDTGMSNNTGSNIQVGGGYYPKSGVGGGVFAEGNITLSGNASITNNTAEQGGGVYVNGSMVMEGGTISGNKAEHGAGVFVPKERTFTQKGGTITANEADFAGGGVYVESGGTYNAQGGTVTGNKAGGDGGENVFRQ